MRPPSLNPDPFRGAPADSAGDQRLWLGLLALLSVIVLAAVGIHWLLPPKRVLPLPASGSGSGSGNLNTGAPLMTRQQLLENQQAIPELLDFNSQTPPPNPLPGTRPLGTPGLPSSIGTSSLGR
ncbi:MAG: hypothetical protein VKO39_07310 [Cyanobacteriota bacterium]|nr:hypothetical protein [Cyanobacteriota bacterium]